ncbi:MAG: transferrin receptor-like dimerization domain-containing protein, partial [Phycisphaerales bacterium]
PRRVEVGPGGVAAPGVRGEGSALDAWGKSSDGAPSYGDLGGGSDHVGFWCHAGVPSVSLSSGGSEGTSYHSNYDTVAWYRATVGDDYAAARLVAGIASAMAAEFARADDAHASATRLVDDAARQARALAKLAIERGVPLSSSQPIEEIADSFDRMRSAAIAFDARPLDEVRLKGMRDIVALWMRSDGLPGRPWFRNLYAASDRHSGYATSPWPMLREAIEDFQPDDAAAVARVDAAAAAYRAVARSAERLLQASSPFPTAVD